MDIYNSQFAHKAHTLSSPHFRGVSTQPTTETNRISSPIRDEVSFSREAQSFGEIASLSDSSSSAAPRLDLINRIRSEIAAGTYDTEDKFEAALGRMLGGR